MTASDTIPLEDELGDVIEKAMRGDNLTSEEVAVRSGVPVSKIREAIDYHPGMDCAELRRLAAALGLNEVGLCALGAGRYPLPQGEDLPFQLWPLRMPHGIGVVNAYVVAEHGASNGILFDTGADLAGLGAAWPREIRRLDAVFLTHVEAEHVGGLSHVIERFGAPTAYVPSGAQAPCGWQAGEGEEKSFGGLTVKVFGTPGHAAAHNCYVVRSASDDRRPLLISGDLLFAGSVGGSYFSHRQLRTHLRRVLDAVPPQTVIAPGHGPLTTVENELRFNPFVA